MKVNIACGIFLLMISLIWFGCDTGLEGTVNPGPFITGNDPFNDLTVLNDRFYLTNFDQGEGSGNRINLYAFDASGEPSSMYDLQMNGQGYISISSGDGDLFMFCQTGLILRVTPFGEYVAMNWLGSGFIGWQAGGVLADINDTTYALLWKPEDSLAVYLMNPDQLTLGILDTTIYFTLRVDFRSLCVNDQLDSIFLLCSDSAGADYIEIMDQDWVYRDEMALSDSLVSGISYLDGEIWVSTEDRRIVPLSQVQN